MPEPPIRVLYVISTARVGGAERRALNLARYADAGRVRASVLALEAEGELFGEAEAAGVKMEGWAAGALPSPRRLVRMQRYLRAGGFQVVQAFGLRAELLARGPASRAGAKLVSSICSVDPWRRWYHTALDRATAGGVGAWISNSEAGKRAAVEREGVPANRVVVVPTGIPDRRPVDAEGRAAARRELGVGPDEGPVIGVVANLREAKGYGDLIEAVGRLAERWPRLVVLCAGREDSGGADAGGKIGRLVRERGLEGRIRLLGFMEDGARVYDAADLAVLASHWEGMPSALIEAMRAALGSVATDVGGVGEVIRAGEEGLLVPARDPAALGGAIGEALGDGERLKRWGTQARRRYEEQFAVDRMVERTAEVYKALMRPG